jgi:flagellar export protein FliJ
MAYRFRFQALLKYRQHLLTQAQTEMATAMRHYEAARNRFERTIAERDENLLLFQEKKRSGIKVAEYNLFQDYFVFLEQQLLLLKTELEELSRDVEEAKEVLMLRERELKMMEITDTKDRSVFRQIEAKKEQARLDERAVIGDFRKRIEP